MELLQLKYFQAVAEAGKIAAAAEALYISPPALSATIARLERELGVKLFDRLGNRIVLNAQGKIFLRHVNSALESLASAKLELARSVADAPRQVQVAVTASELWTPLIAAFAHARPEIALSSKTISPAQLNAGLFLGRYAFLLAERGDFSDENMDSIPLFIDEPMVMVHKDHPLARRQCVELDELAGEHLILPIAGLSLSLRVKRLLRDAGVEAQNAYECATFVCRCMVEEGLGLAFTTRYTMRQGDETIRYLPIAAPACRWEQRLYWHKGRSFTPEEQTLRDFIETFYQSGGLPG